MKKEISKLLIKHLNGFSQEEVMNLIEIPPLSEMGDFSLPCFTMAKTLRNAPAKIAAELKSSMHDKETAKVINKMEVVNGYLNFYVNQEYYIDKVLCEALKEDYGKSNDGCGKTVCMDYSSPNIAKNFHVGHLRTTIIGNSLYKIFRKLGYDVVRINHLGDWGTQFGKLIVAYKKWSSKEQVEQIGIEELLRIYVLFNSESEIHPELLDQAREWFTKMENGDDEAITIWKWFKDISMIEYERMYKILGVEFDYYLGESFYMNQVPELVCELKDKKLLEESQGATIVNLEEYNMPPCLITKKDGSSIYHSRDIATVLYRKEKFNFDKCLYVTGMEQKLHFAQVFKVIELMGYDYYKQLIHIPYGLVSLEGGKLSTRNGNIIYAEDIMKEAISRAANLIEQKNPQLDDKDDVARKVGVGAVIFNDLYNQRIKNIEFTWENVLNFEGATGPYAQYTYARAKSILRKCKIDNINLIINTKFLTDEASFNIVKVIDAYPAAVKEAAERYEPCVIARYIISLATAFNKFYHECNILNAPIDLKESRIILVHITQQIIKDALGLLGIECPEEM